jgi:hypothetical protein
MSSSEPAEHHVVLTEEAWSRAMKGAGSLHTSIGETDA